MGVNFQRKFHIATALELQSLTFYDHRSAFFDGTVTLCALPAATVLSRNCCADFGRSLTKKVVLYLRDGPGVTAPLQTNIAPLTAVSNPPPFRYPPFERPQIETPS